MIIRSTNARHGVLVDEAHLEVELRELGLPVAAQVLVAEAARDLEVAVDARDHQQLLELLRALRQGVDGARLEAADGTMKSRAPSGVLLIRLGVSTSTKPLSWWTSRIAWTSAAAQEQPALHRLAPDVEVAVLEAQRSRRSGASGSLM